MRLSDILSKPIDLEFKQVEGFLDNKKLKEGKSRKLLIGKVALTYFCAKCDSDLSFVSKEDIFGIGVNNKQISVDCVLTCPRCGNQLPVWFLVEISPCKAQQSYHQVARRGRRPDARKVVYG